MTKRDLASLLDGLLIAVSNAFAGITETEAEALGHHLQILQTAPEPDLAAGRRRVIAEAARLEHQQDLHRLVGGAQPSFSLALVLAVFLLMVAPFAAVGLAWNSGRAGNSVFGFFSTPTLAFAPLPATHTAEAIFDSPTPISNPAPSNTAMKMTVVPIRVKGPTIVPEPTPGPMLTLTVPSPVQPAY